MLKSQFKRGAVGAAIGLAFAIVGIAFDLFNSSQPFSVTGIVNMFSAGLLPWIMLIVPLFSGVLFFLQQRVLDTREALFLDEQEKGKKVMANVADFLKLIEQGDLENAQANLGDAQLNVLFSSLVAKLSNQKETDRRTNWTTAGQAKFGEILRTTNDLKQLSEMIIQALVKYVELNQGAIYIHEREDANEGILNLMACYAYDRKKYVSNAIEPGQGLVGQCFLERDAIILKKVPADYVRITSGLGGATPTYVVLVPIKENEEVQGVLEVAGFRALDDYQIEFLKSICEAFASVIRSVKVADHTRRLLEETQNQTEQLRMQEEEIRQNMEEMQATQEQLSRQLEEAKILRERVERREHVMALTTILSETDLYGKIMYVNDKFCEVAKYNRNELMGEPHNIVRHPDMPKELFQLFWSTIKRGEVFRGIVKNRAKDGSHYWVDATIVPIKNEEGEVIKYVGSRYHIKDERLALLLYNEQAALFGWPRIDSGELKKGAKP